MDKVIYAHPLKEAEPDHPVVWLFLKAHGRFPLRSEVFMSGCAAKCVAPKLAV